MTHSLLGLFSKVGIERPTLIGMSAVLMWSGTIGLYSGVSSAFGPVGGAAMIFSLAALFSVVLAGKATFQNLPKFYVLVGGALFVLYEIALAFAIGFAVGQDQALEVGMINYLWPSLTIALAIGLGLERADWKIIPGLLLSFFGVIWVASGEEGISFARMLSNLVQNPLAYGMAIAAALIWPLYTMVTRLRSSGRNCTPLFMIATAVTVWAIYFGTQQPAIVYDTKGAIMVVAFGLLTTLAYSAWTHGVLHGNLTLLASASYFAPVLSVATSSVIFLTMPAMNFWIGASIVTLGSLMCWASTRAKA